MGWIVFQLEPVHRRRDWLVEARPAFQDDSHKGASGEKNKTRKTEIDQTAENKAPAVTNQNIE